MKLNCAMPDPNTAMIIATGFRDTLDLGAEKLDNYSINNHTVVCVVLVLCNQEEVTHDIDRNSRTKRKSKQMQQIDSFL